MIYNVDLNKVYIGQTTNFKQRATMHRQQLMKGTHSNKELQNDFNNGCKLAFAILETEENDIDKRKLLLREKQYIYAFHNRMIKTYNKETNNQIIENLFFDIIYPEIDKIHRSFYENFGCDMALLINCKPETRMNKCIEKGMK